MPDDTRRKIEDIVAGNVFKGQGYTCEAVPNFLCRRFATSTTVNEDFDGRAIVKEEQAGLTLNGCASPWTTPVGVKAL